MAALTLTSPRQRPLRPLVEAAIHNELRLLQTGIRQTFQKNTNLTNALLRLTIRA